LNINQLSWLTAPFQDPFPFDSSKKVLEEAQFNTPGVQGCDLTALQDTELHSPVVSAPRAAPSLHLSKQSLLVCRYKVQLHTSPLWLLHHPSQEVSIGACQEPPALFVPRCAVPPADVRVVAVPP